MVTTQSAAEILEAALKDFETANPNIEWRSGGRQKLLTDAINEVEYRNGFFRTRKGTKINNIQDYFSLSLEHGSYTIVQPSKANDYAPAFPLRSEGTKATHKKLAAETLRKAFQLSGFVFLPGTQDKVIDALSDFLIPADTHKGLRFFKVSDLPVGTVWSKEGISPEDLESTLSQFIDQQATKISRLAHKSELRRKAESLLPGAQKRQIDDLEKELAEFERRSLLTGKTMPTNVPKVHVTDELQKFFVHGGRNKSDALILTRNMEKSIDDFQPVMSRLAEIEIPSTHEPYKF